jgi:hypothetical protein
MPSTVAQWLVMDAVCYAVSDTELGFWKHDLLPPLALRDMYAKPIRQTVPPFSMLFVPVVTPALRKHSLPRSGPVNE